VCPSSSIALVKTRSTASITTPAIYGPESYISVPIILPNGDYFGNLCAIDPRPEKVSENRIVRMFEVFAQLIAMQIDNEQRQWSTEALLMNERETANLREQFIAVLGHDLRNPLAAVDATAELLMRNPSGIDLPALGTRLKRTSARMGRLIDDVMDFARGRLGRGIPATIGPVDDLASVLRAAIGELSDSNLSRAVRSEIAVHGTVQCDSVRLQQLLSNLVGNALAHGSEEVPIVVQARTEAEQLVVSVINGGPPSSRTFCRKFSNRTGARLRARRAAAWGSACISARRSLRRTAERWRCVRALSWVPASHGPASSGPGCAGDQPIAFWSSAGRRAGFTGSCRRSRAFRSRRYRSGSCRAPRTTLPRHTSVTRHCLRGGSGIGRPALP
jgi:hypothetical protein